MISQKISLLLEGFFKKALTSVNILPNILLPNILKLCSKEKEMYVIPVRVKKRINKLSQQ